MLRITGAYTIHESATAYASYYYGVPFIPRYVRLHVLSSRRKKYGFTRRDAWEWEELFQNDKYYTGKENINRDFSTRSHDRWRQAHKKAARHYVRQRYKKACQDYMRYGDETYLYTHASSYEFGTRKWW